MAKTPIGTRPARHELRRKIETKTETSHTMSWVADGFRTGTVQILVDIDRLAALYGERALSNKSRRATVANGCVEVLALPGTIKDNRLSDKAGAA